MKQRWKVALFLGEVLAVAALRAIYVLRRDRILPRGSKVNRVRGRPVYKPSTGSGESGEADYSKLSNRSPQRPTEKPADSPSIAGIYVPPPKDGNKA